MTPAQQATLDVLIDLVDVTQTGITTAGSNTSQLLILSAPRSHGQVQAHDVWLSPDGGLAHAVEA